MHFSVTDLPLPDWPMIATDSPGSIARFTPSSTRIVPKALATSTSLIFGPLTRTPSR